ncbi:MAG: response regulator [Patescibacteria group bacterium]
MSKGKILFIDDDSFLRKVYEAELRERGYEVHLAVDGDDGLEKVASLQPDLIILDLIMPNKSGFEVLSELGRYEETRPIPVIVLSNLAQSDDQQRALDLGAVDYLVKDNTTLDVINEKIELQLKKASSKRAVSDGSGTRSLRAELDRKASVKKAEPEEPAADAGQPRASQPEPPKRGTAVRGHHFCPNCGFKLELKAKFCPDCGFRME